MANLDITEECKTTENGEIFLYMAPHTCYFWVRHCNPSICNCVSFAISPSLSWIRCPVPTNSLQNLQVLGSVVGNSCLHCVPILWHWTFRVTSDWLDTYNFCTELVRFLPRLVHGVIHKKYYQVWVLRWNFAFSVYSVTVELMKHHCRKLKASFEALTFAETALSWVIDSAFALILFIWVLLTSAPIWCTIVYYFSTGQCKPMGGTVWPRQAN